MKNLFYIVITTLLLFSLNVISMDFEFTKNVQEWNIVFIFIMFIFLAEFVSYKKVPIDLISNEEKSKNAKKINESRKSVFIFIWLCLSLCIIFSKLNNHDNLSSTIFMLFSVPIFFVFKVPKLKKYKERILYPSSILSFLPFLIVLFYIISRDGRNNVVGVLTSFTGIILLTIINDRLKSRKTFFMLIFGLIFMLLILINGSRAGLLSFLLGFSCFFVGNLKKNNYRVKMEKYLMFHAALSIIIISCMIYFNQLLNLLFNKWNGNSDISSGREFIWKETIKEANWFGHGSNYFYQNFFIGDAHNIFIQILGQYGIIPLLLFLTMSIYLLVLLAKLKDTNYNAIFLSYFSLGLFENVLFIDFRFGTITFIIWVYIGLLLDKKIGGSF